MKKEIDMVVTSSSNRGLWNPAVATLRLSDGRPRELVRSKQVDHTLRVLYTALTGFEKLSSGGVVVAEPGTMLCLHVSGSRG